MLTKHLNGETLKRLHEQVGIMPWSELGVVIPAPKQLHKINVLSDLDK